MIVVPPQASENVSEFLSDLEDTLIYLDVPVWKVVLGGFGLVALFVGGKLIPRFLRISRYFYEFCV